MSRPRSRRPLLFAREAGAGRDRIIVLERDNAGWHTAPNLAVPDGIELVSLPPYSPELQPAEHLWELCDEPLANQNFKSLAELTSTLGERCCQLTQQMQIIRSTTLFHWWPTAQSAVTV